MKLSHIRKYLTKLSRVQLSIIALVIVIGTVGVYAQYQHSRNSSDKNKASSNQSSDLPVTSANTPGLSSGENSAAEANQSSSRSSSTSSSTPKTQTKYLPAGSSLPPPVTKNCTGAWDVPFKHIFVAGTGPFYLGSNGLSETCTYSDGRLPETTVAIAPKDQVNYMNVSSADYNTAAGICDDYPAAYFQACMQVVWHG